MCIVYRRVVADVADERLLCHGEHGLSLVRESRNIQAIDWVYLAFGESAEMLMSRVAPFALASEPPGNRDGACHVSVRLSP